MEKFNVNLAKLLNILLIAILVLLPLGFTLRLVEAFQMEERGVNTEWTGILFFFFGAFEIYLLLVFSWFRLIRNRKMSVGAKITQLVIIFIIGVIPGIIALYPAFVKN